MIEFVEIGIIETEIHSADSVITQPPFAHSKRGRVILKEEFIKGLKDLEGFSHVILIYFLHKSKETQLLAKPFLDNEARGVFATRAPVRPNKIGLSVVRLLEINENIIDVENADMINGSPLLDIKPFIPAFDCYDADYRIGWLKDKLSR